MPDLVVPFGRHESKLSLRPGLPVSWDRVWRWSINRFVSASTWPEECTCHARIYTARCHRYVSVGSSRSKARLAHKTAVASSVHCPYARDSVVLDGLFPSTGPEKDFNLKSHEALTKEFMNAPYHDEQLIRRSLVLSDCDFNRKGMKSPSREASCHSAAEKEPALLSQPSSPDDSPAS